MALLPVAKGGRVTIPPEYAGREQTLLKHRVLAEYLDGWAHKRAARSRYETTRLWYVDCFAGPWNAADEDLRDTSVSIGLDALRKAASTWNLKEQHVALGAIFVESSPKAFQGLKAFLEQQPAGIDLRPLQGEFGEKVPEINRRIGHDPAFLFVDPTGWKGAAMRFIVPLASPPERDVLINVMFNHLNRFKDDPRRFLREQIADFFGVVAGEIPPRLDEDGLFDFYREKLRERCRLPFVADLAIPHPTQERTWFRLVVGVHHPAAVELFRSVERRVCGDVAGEVREEAKRRGNPQLSLGVGAAPDQSYWRLHQDGLVAAGSDVLALLRERSPRSYGELWPRILSDRHIGKADLNSIVWDLHKSGRLRVRGLVGLQRTPKDDNLVELLQG